MTAGPLPRSGSYGIVDAASETCQSCKGSTGHQITEEIGSLKA